MKLFKTRSGAALTVSARTQTPRRGHAPFGRRVPLSRLRLAVAATTPAPIGCGMKLGNRKLKKKKKNLVNQSARNLVPHISSRVLRANGAAAALSRRVAAKQNKPKWGASSRKSQRGSRAKKRIVRRPPRRSKLRRQATRFPLATTARRRPNSTAGIRGRR